jgi:MinD-like ATPase involved in chromosome partitioning or flagellar assembly
MGVITTFYSYKGGVGRTMALANVAILLARKQRRVLMIDWDLEAPGLERYFSGFVTVRSGNGLLPMCLDFVERRAVNYEEYLSKFDLGEGREISFLSSGRDNDPNYSKHLETFDWNAFFSESGGGTLLEQLRDSWKRDFDAVLIDSRTGLSDTGGICTIQLPDVIIAMFTANYQSILGVRDVLQLAQKARQKLAYDRMALTVLPLPARFGSVSEFIEAQTWIRTIAEVFAEWYGEWLPSWADISEIVQQLKVPQVDYFGFGEKLAVVEQGINDPQGMGFIYNKVAELLDDDFQNAEKTLSLQMRSAKIIKKDSKFNADSIGPLRTHSKKVGSKGYAYDLYVSTAGDQATSNWINEFMRRSLWRLREDGDDLNIFQDIREIEAGELWHSQIREALTRSKILIAFISPRYFRSAWCLAEFMTFLARSQSVSMQSSIIPIRLSVGADFPEFGSSIQSLDVKDYFYASPAFWTTERSFELESKVIIPFAARVQYLLQSVPEFDPEWEVVDPASPLIEGILKSTNPRAVGRPTI